MAFVLFLFSLINRFFKNFYLLSSLLYSVAMIVFTRALFFFVSRHFLIFCSLFHLIAFFQTILLTGYLSFFAYFLPSSLFFQTFFGLLNSPFSCDSFFLLSLFGLPFPNFYLLSFSRHSSISFCFIIFFLCL